MKYELIGRIIFEAEDTQDAFVKLSVHFTALQKGEESELPLVGTNLVIKPLGIELDSTEEGTKTTSYRGRKT